MSFSPGVFGPIYWQYAHLTSATATTKEKRKLYVEWLNNLATTLPCEKCRLHFIENIKNHPVEPYAKSNVSLFYHSWKLHDIVNQQLNKPMKQRLTYEQAFEIYFGKSQVKSNMSLAQLDNGEDIVQPHYDSREENYIPQQHYHTEHEYIQGQQNSEQQINQPRTQQFVVRNSKQSVNQQTKQIRNQSQQAQAAPQARPSREVCQGDCGKPVYQVEQSNFEAFRAQERKKFISKNE